MATEVTKGAGGQTPQRPVDAFTAMRDEMDRMFERFERGWPRLPSVFGAGADSGLMVPELDVHDNGKQITIEADLPGVEEKDVTVTLASGILTIKGEKRTEREKKEASYYVAERSFGSFERSLRLPDTIDDGKLEARFDKGVLRIVAPKRPEAVKSERRIEINKS